MSKQVIKAPQTLKTAQILKQMPKIELHAHLFGSITQEQLLVLLQEHNCHAEYDEFKQIKENLDFVNIFDKAFTYLPKVTHTIDDLRKIIRLVLNNFISDNVAYIELRSTPKALKDSSFEQYLETIIQEFAAHQDKIRARYIVSINRGYPPEYYKDILSIMQSVDPLRKFIVGLDYSGDARNNTFNDYLPLMQRARESGYKITVHTPELETALSELDTIIDFRPDRLGHFLFYNDEQLQTVKHLGIPIEICPTSNFIVGAKNSHHFIDIINKGITEVTICTDDLLLFRASLSEEWSLFMNEVDFDIERISSMLYRSVDYMFDEEYKSEMRKLIKNFKQSL